MINCRDMSCKVKTGFSGSKVMRNKKQTNKLSNNPKKSHWVKSKHEEEEENTEQTQGSEQGDLSSLPYIEVEGEMFVDIEKVLSMPQWHTASGRPMYIPGHLIPIRQFNPLEHTPEHPSWIAYGKRRTGKSFFMRWWLYHMRHNYEQIYVFTETKINGFWEQYVPRQAVYPSWDEDRALDILNFQKWVIENPREAAEHGYTDRTCTILDDVIATKELRNDGDDGMYAAMYVQGRHTHMTVGTATQKATAIPPKVRDNIDLVFILRQESETEIERIWKEHMSRLNRVTASEMMEYWTRTLNYKKPNEIRYTFVIDTDPCKSYNERFYWATADDPGQFRVGSKVFWEELDY
jgi:hypothetical protein